jgi:hypothetical protein
MSWWSTCWMRHFPRAPNWSRCSQRCRRRRPEQRTALPPRHPWPRPPRLLRPTAFRHHLRHRRNRLRRQQRHRRSQRGPLLPRRRRDRCPEQQVAQRPAHPWPRPSCRRLPRLFRRHPLFGRNRVRRQQHRKRRRRRRRPLPRRRSQRKRLEPPPSCLRPPPQFRHRPQFRHPPRFRHHPHVPRNRVQKLQRHPRRRRRPRHPPRRQRRPFWWKSQRRRRSQQSLHRTLRDRPNSLRRGQPRYPPRHRHRSPCRRPARLPICRRHWHRRRTGCSR